MPKQLIIESCLVNHGQGIVTACQPGEFIEIQRDTAVLLARMGRALFVDRSDDSDKSGRYTASPEMLKAAQDMAKGKAKAGGD